MTKLLKSLSVAAAVAAITGGVTYAYFGAQGSVAGNTVSTGTMTLAINSGSGKPITISDALPGYADANYRWFDAFNNGTMPAEFFMKFSKDTGEQALYDQLKIELRDGGFTGTCDGPIIYTGLVKDFITNHKISDSNVHAASSVTDVVKDNIPAGNTMRVCQKISFPDTGTDQSALEGKSVTFTETVNSRPDLNPDALP